MKTIIVSVMMMLAIAVAANGQYTQNSRNSADQTMRSSGRVNPSTLGMEFDVPLGGYQGRGLNLPLGLNYSSKVWRFDDSATTPGSATTPTRVYVFGLYSESAAAGWTSSLAQPYIEYTGELRRYDSVGRPLPTPGTYPTPDGDNYVRRITVFLPGGASHELRDGDAEAPSPTLPFPGGTWDGTFYASDGSGLKYEEITNVSPPKYRLSFPDGSYYDFSSTLVSRNQYGPNVSRVRPGIRLTDVHGNFVQFYGPDSQEDIYDPYGSWIDQLGRKFPIMIPPDTPQNDDREQPREDFTDTFTLPGMGAPYVLTWKRLGEAFAPNPSPSPYELLSVGGSGGAGSGGDLPYEPALFASEVEPMSCSSSGSTFLYVEALAFNHSDGLEGWTIPPFNPLVLTEVHLPNGTSYVFKYNPYGEITHIEYPTGGHEEFAYQKVASVAKMDANYQQSNRGVIDRKVYEDSSTHYDWHYSADASNENFRVRTTAPDGTITDNFMFRGILSTTCDTSGINPYGARWGYDDALAGKTYETRAFTSGTPHIVQRTLTEWASTAPTPGVVIRATPELTLRTNARELSVQNITYDGTDGVSAITSFEYDDQNAVGSPLNVTMRHDYEYTHVSVGSIAASQSLSAVVPKTNLIGDAGAMVRTTETTYRLHDTRYASDQSGYNAKNLLRLATVSKVRDGTGTGTILSQSETVYDEDQTSLGIRGNPTTLLAWDSTKGASTSSSANIATHARFDTYGNRYEATDALGNTTTTTFDSTYHTFPVEVTSAIPDQNEGTYGSSESFVTTATYDPLSGLPLTTTDANGLETRIEYDEDTLRPRFVRNYVSGTETQVGGTSETDYHDGAGDTSVKNITQIDDTHFAETTTYFDGIGRAWKTEKKDSGGNIFVEKTFDEQGRVSAVSNPYRSGETKHWTTNTYDLSSRVIEVEMADSAKVLTSYGVTTSSPIGITKTMTDEAGKKRKGISDAMGNMVRVIEDPDGTSLSTDYLFDKLGNLRKTTQGGQYRYFRHDSLGRLLYAKQVEQDANSAFSGSGYTDAVTTNDQWSAKYVYDDNGNITSTVDANNKTVSATYDHLNRIILRDYSDSTMPDVRFYYDGKYLDIAHDSRTATGSVKGKTTRIESSVSQTNYTAFDVFGRPLSYEQTTDGHTYNTAYTYNLGGAMIDETYPSTRIVKNTVDADGQLSRVQSKKNSNQGYWAYASGFSYDTAGNVEAMQLGNGLWETAGYNDRLQVKEIGLGRTDSNQSLLKLEYKYETGGTVHDNNGSMREQKITVPAVSSTPGFTAVQTYTYDELNRIESATEMVSTTETWKQVFDYDRFGNKNFLTGSGQTSTLGSCTTAVCNPSFETGRNRFELNQPDTEEDHDYVYDANGNILRDATGQRFGYDSENHQKEFFSLTNSGSTPDAIYHYDGEGRRVKKVTAEGTTIFVYDASSKVVAEYSTTVAEASQVSYLTQDHLGSPRVITDQNQSVTSRKDFTAFGEENISSDRTSARGYQPPESEVRQDYTGYEKDTESGLEFAQARYYNGKHGRYMSVDPLTASASIRNPQTFNRYSYVLNSPYKFTDPLGLAAQGPNGYTWNPKKPGFHNVGGYWYTTRELNEMAEGASRMHADPPPARDVKTERINLPYEVTGKTAVDAVKDSIAQKGSSEGVTSAIFILNTAETVVKPNLLYDRRTGSYTFTLTVVDAAVDLTITTALPVWKDEGSKSRKEQDKWEEGLRGLREHEDGHAADGIARANEFRDSVNGLMGIGEGKTEDEAYAAAAVFLNDRISAVYKIAVKNLDRDGARRDADGGNIIRIKR